MTVHKHLNNISPSSIKWCFDRNWWRETRSCCGMPLLCGSFTIKVKNISQKLRDSFNKNSKTQCETSSRHSETSIATRDRLRLRKNCSPSKIHLSPVLSQSTRGQVPKTPFRYLSRIASCISKASAHIPAHRFGIRFSQYLWVKISCLKAPWRGNIPRMNKTLWQSKSEKHGTVWIL